MEWGGVGWERVGQGNLSSLVKPLYDAFPISGSLVERELTQKYLEIKKLKYSSAQFSLLSTSFWCALYLIVVKKKT